METLSFHVQIEENHFFPACQEAYPMINLQSLFDDHEKLHEKESNLHSEFHESLALLNDTGADVTKLVTSLVKLGSSALAFDDVLMNHLGEEEEIVVPICLTKRINL